MLIRVRSTLSTAQYAVIGGAVVAMGGYLLLVKQNQVNIENIQQRLAELKVLGEKNQHSIAATKLFIAQAHPDRNISTLSSIQKLQKFSPEEVTTLATELGSMEFKQASENTVENYSATLGPLIAAHKLTKEDIRNFSKLIAAPQKRID